MRVNQPPYDMRKEEASVNGNIKVKKSNNQHSLLLCSEDLFLLDNSCLTKSWLQANHVKLNAEGTLLTPTVEDECYMRLKGLEEVANLI